MVLMAGCPPWTSTPVRGRGTGSACTCPDATGTSAGEPDGDVAVAITVGDRVQRAGTRRAGLVLSAASVGLVVDNGFRSTSAPLFDRLAPCALALVVVWVAWRAMIRPHVEVGQDALVVRNLFSTWQIRYEKVARVLRKGGVALELTDGALIEVYAFSASRLGSRATERELTRYIKARGLGREETAPVDATRRLDIGWLDVAMLCPLGVVLTVAALS